MLGDIKALVTRFEEATERMLELLEAISEDVSTLVQLEERAQRGEQ